MAQIHSFFLFVFTLFVALQSNANLRLVEWHPGTTSAPLIIPVRQGETPAEAAHRYLKNIERSPDLMEIFAGQTPHLPEMQFKEISSSDYESRALIMANAAKDYTTKSERLNSFKSIFAKQGHRSYVLPVAAALGLNPAENRQFQEQVSRTFPLLVALGGEDVDPSQYRKENFHSRNTIPTRDLFEIQLIKSYVAAERGFLLGVCRGAQISSVALGYQLIQDLPFHIGEKVSHADDWHDIEILKTKNQLLSKLAPDGRLNVNSLHHQSIIYKEGGPLQIAARSHDGVTEALEFLNGKGLLLQFHPELMNNKLGESILFQVIQQKRRISPGLCQKIFL